MLNYIDYNMQNSITKYENEKCATATQKLHICFKPVFTHVSFCKGRQEH